MAYDCNYFVFDLETGGLITKEKGIPPVTEIAICVVDGETLLDVAEYSSLVKPYVPLDNYTPMALNVSNITIDMLDREGKDANVIIQELISFIKKNSKKKKSILVAHNGDEFDIPIIDKFFTDHGEDLSKYVETKTSFDTMWLARAYKPTMAKFNLGSCLEDLNIDIQQAHRALNDTRATKDMFVKLMSNLRGLTSSRETINKTRIKFQY